MEQPVPQPLDPAEPTKKWSTPSLTSAQLLGLLAGVVGMLVSQGLVTNAQEKLVVGAGVIVVVAVWILADAVIRYGRASIVTAQISSAFVKQSFSRRVEAAEEQARATAKDARLTSERLRSAEAVVEFQGRKLRELGYTPTDPIAELVDPDATPFQPPDDAQVSEEPTARIH